MRVAQHRRAAQPILWNAGSLCSGASSARSHLPPSYVTSGSTRSRQTPCVRYTSRLRWPLTTTGATMSSSPIANWSSICHVCSSWGSSHHRGLQMGSSSAHASRACCMSVSSTCSLTPSAALHSACASAEKSHGARLNWIAGISALACAHRTSSSLSGLRPKYALPPIMSGRQKGYPSRPEVSRVGMSDCRPLPTPHSLNRSPILVSIGTPCVW
mmetsp:Transcript_16404/g.55838  ORF Transcript_16404/g.55838 Transcript_16404/m.55838 type:complete len:214 (+) Transcript_16404:96-737(+)